jgi:hypothetical protein
MELQRRFSFSTFDCLKLLCVLDHKKLGFLWSRCAAPDASFVRIVLALQDAAAQSAALAVEQVRERVASFHPLSVFIAQVQECAQNSISALVAFLRSHYFARSAEA